MKSWCRFFSPLPAAFLLWAASPQSAALGWPCREDIRTFCGEVVPGGGRVEACLHEHESRLSPACRQARQGIREKVGCGLDACLPEVERFCHGIPAGEGRIARCLKQHEAELTADCRDQAQVLEDLVGRDNPCYEDQERFCGDVVPGRGRVLDCMANHRPDLSDACNAYVEAVLLQARNRIMEAAQEFMDACKADLQKHCRGVPPGKGRLIDCLRENEGEISEACRTKIRPAGK